MAGQHHRVDIAGTRERSPQSGAHRARRDSPWTFPRSANLSAVCGQTAEHGRMKYQLDLFGVIVPSLLLWGALAYVLARILSKLIARAGLYRFVWHPALFDFALFVCLVAGLVFIS